MGANRNRLGVGLVVVGSLLLVVSGLWHLEVLLLPVSGYPGVLNALLGVVLLSAGAYATTRGRATA